MFCKILTFNIDKWERENVAFKWKRRIRWYFLCEKMCSTLYWFSVMYLCFSFHLSISHNVLILWFAYRYQGTCNICSWVIHIAVVNDLSCHLSPCIVCHSHYLLSCDLPSPIIKRLDDHHVLNWKKNLHCKQTIFVVTMGNNWTSRVIGLIRGFP